MPIASSARFALPLRQAANRRIEQCADVETLDEVGFEAGAAAEEAEREVDRPSHGLRRPRHDGIGQIEQRGRAGTVAHRPPLVHERAGVERQHPAEALEQRGFAGAVGTDQAEHFARPDGEGHIAQRAEVSVRLCKLGDLEHQSPNVWGMARYYQ